MVEEFLPKLRIEIANGQRDPDRAARVRLVKVELGDVAMAASIERQDPRQCFNHRGTSCPGFSHENHVAIRPNGQVGKPAKILDVQFFDPHGGAILLRSSDRRVVVGDGGLEPPTSRV